MSRSLAAVAACLVAASGGANAAEMKVYVSGAMAHALETISEDFTKKNGHTLDFQANTTGVIKDKVRKGEAADIIEVTSVGMDALEKEKLVVPGTRVELARANVGIAVAAQDALVVPTIFDADSKSLGQIARDAYELAEKVREGKITPPEVAGGTFTVSNLGMYGIDEFTAVINPPQAALLTVGALKKRPAVDDNGRVVAR